MGRKWPVGDIPETAVVPDGDYLVEVASLDGDEPSSTGKLMYAAEFRIVEPATFKGLVVNDNFVIGSDNDRGAEDPDTWKASVGARRMRRMFRAAQVPEDDDIDDMIEGALGQRLILIVTQEEGEYQGRKTTKNRIQAFYSEGERAVEAASAPKATRAPAVAPRSAPRTAAPLKAAPAPAPAKVLAKAPAKEKLLRCSICDEDVSRSGFAEHVNAHEE